jgi:two-component system C4-dicarboxylate transport response regulator DctD
MQVPDARTSPGGERLGRYIPAMQPLVLVVDDEPHVRLVTSRYLEEAGFECIQAGAADEAMAWLDRGRIPDVAVLDIRLPDQSGPELALRIHARFPSIPVLFISAWPEAQSKPEELAPLRWLFVQKPFVGATLKEAVRRLLA